MKLFYNYSYKLRSSIVVIGKYHEKKNKKKQLDIR